MLQSLILFSVWWGMAAMCTTSQCTLWFENVEGPFYLCQASLGDTEYCILHWPQKSDPPACDKEECMHWEMWHQVIYQISTKMYASNIHTYSLTAVNTRSELSEHHEKVDHHDLQPPYKYHVKIHTDCYTPKRATEWPDIVSEQI